MENEPRVYRFNKQVKYGNWVAFPKHISYLHTFQPR